jgi:hypothetical protein
MSTDFARLIVRVVDDLRLPDSEVLRGFFLAPLQLRG